jgi:hypothetical protein
MLFNTVELNFSAKAPNVATNELPSLIVRGKVVAERAFPF